MPESIILDIVRDRGTVQLDTLLAKLREHNVSDSETKAGLWRLVAAAEVNLNADNSVSAKPAGQENV
jgi:hypothetical protein